MFSLRRDAGLCVWSAVLVMVLCGSAAAADAVVQNPFAGPAAAPQAGFAAKGVPAPDTAPVPPPIYPQVHLQQPSRGYRAVPLAASEADTRARKVIDAALEKGVEDALEFNEMPLRDVLRTIEEQWHAPIRIDQKSLDEAGIDPETPIIDSAVKGETLRSVLQAVLDGIDLTWVVKGERLVITTKEKAGEFLTTRLYPLPWGTTHPPVNYQPLIDTIVNTLDDPQAWADVGGNGQIRPADGGEPMLVVMQTEEIHGKVEALLRGMQDRAMAQFLDADGQPRRTPVVRVYRCPDKETRNELATNLAALCNASLAADGDPAAKVTALAENLVVQSAKPDFHALAAQIVAATVGVRPLAPDGVFLGGMGAGTPLGGMGAGTPQPSSAP